jgi:hypothetical protein
MLTMIWSTNVQNLNSRFLILWIVQKWQTLTDCEISKICTVRYFRSQNLSFLHSSNYKVFWLENLHDCRSQHCLLVDLISFFLKLQNSIFEFFKKRAKCSSSYICGFRCILDECFLLPWCMLLQLIETSVHILDTVCEADSPYDIDTATG